MVGVGVREAREMREVREVREVKDVGFADELQTLAKQHKEHTHTHTPTRTNPRSLPQWQS